MAKHVTLSQIGKRAGVSNVAVGAALGLLSKKSSVRLSKEKAEMIRQVAREMGYQPNLLARAFRNQRTRMVGVLFRVVSNPLSISYLIDCVHRELLQHDYHAYLSPFQSQYNVLQDSVMDLLAWRVDGLILSHVFQTDDTQGKWKQLEARLAEAGVPMVLVESDIQTAAPQPRVNVDLGQAMYDAATYLLKLGHRHLGFLADVRGPTPQRWGGVCRAVAECPGARVQVIELQQVSADAPKIQQLSLSAQATGLKLAAMLDRPTAVICNNDMLAQGLMTGLQDAGLDVPRDMSLTGYDDSDYAVLARPRLTSFAPPVEQVARMASSMLLEHIEEPETHPRQILLSAELIERGSTAPPRAGL
jgi:LacI family transcriptional regulator